MRSSVISTRSVTSKALFVSQQPATSTFLCASTKTNVLVELSYSAGGSTIKAAKNKTEVKTPPWKDSSKTYRCRRFFFVKYWRDNFQDCSWQVMTRPAGVGIRMVKTKSRVESGRVEGCSTPHASDRVRPRGLQISRVGPGPP